MGISILSGRDNSFDSDSFADWWENHWDGYDPDGYEPGLREECIEYLEDRIIALTKTIEYEAKKDKRDSLISDKGVRALLIKLAKVIEKNITGEGTSD